MIQYQLQTKKNEPTTFNLALSAFRIVFMGTPEFAVTSLDALVKAGYNIAAVVTAPDKPAGRGMKLQESEVKKYALEHGLKIFQPEKLKDPAFLEELKLINPDLQVVVAFRMLPEVVWNMPSKGTINLHGSLLPQYRGAAPINWAIINGEKETGVTTFKLKHEIDTGDILLQESFPIGENETTGEVHDKMKEVGARLVVKTVQGIIDGTLKETSQENVQYSMLNTQSSSEASHSPLTTHHSPLKHAPKIFTETCKIDWNKSAKQIHDLIRGLSPFPGAFTTLDGKTFKIYKSTYETHPRGKAGIVIGTAYETDGKTFLKFVCSNGYINIKELQLEGKKRMSIEDFLRGYRF